MIVIKKFFVGLIVVLASNFFAVAHAAEVDPYFAWEIKNLDDYKPYDLLFKTPVHPTGVLGLRDEIYKCLNQGSYAQSAMWCELAEVYHKTAFGTDYFDEGLTELTAKLYLEADEFDKAERKINFLFDNAGDRVTKIRALNLKSDLLNRRENYRQALTVTQEVDELLHDTPNEKLSLINRSRAARAYCGLGELDKCFDIVEKIYPQMEDTFGAADIETLALLSTVAEVFFQARQYEDSREILDEKVLTVSEHYGKKNPAVTAKTFLEHAELSFALGDKETGEEFLKMSSTLATRCFQNADYLPALQLYEIVNELGNKFLGADNPVVMESEFALANLNQCIGNIPESIELCKKNLPTFKKILGERDDQTIRMTELLGRNYFLLGKYSDAKKILEDGLAFCKKNFGDNHKFTVDFKIDLAEIYYRMGKYQTADNLLVELRNNNSDIITADKGRYFRHVFAKIVGSRMKGAYDDYFALVNDDFFRKSITGDRIYLFQLESLNNGNNLLQGNFGDSYKYALMFMNAYKASSRESNPKNLEAMNKVAEFYLTWGDLKNAERFTNQILKLSKSTFGKNNLYEWMALNTLSKIRRAEKNFADALEIDKRALQIAETVCGKKSLERIQSLDSIASDHAASGNFAEAIKIRERTLSECKKILETSDAVTNLVMTNLAKDYLATKRYDDAVNLCDEAFALQKVPWFYENESGSNVSFYPCVTDLLRIKAQARRFSGNDAMANVNYQNLIAAYEFKRMFLNEMKEYDDESKSRWFAEIVSDYKDAAAVAASVDSAKFAFYCTELSKGRNLIDHFHDIIVAKDYMLTPDEKNILATHEKIMASSRAVSEYALETGDENLFFNNEFVYSYLNNVTETFTKELRKKYSDNMILKDSSKRELSQRENFLKNFNVQKNRQAIPNDACFVEFMKVSDDSLVVTFLHNDSEVNAANIPVDKKFFDDCRLYHELNSYFNVKALNDDGKFLWQVGDKFTVTESRERPAKDAVVVKDNEKFNELRQKISAELSEKLLPTIEKFAGNSKHWIISPDAELNLVPFETLTYREKFLIESVDISYVPSLAVLNLMKNRERKNAYLGQSKEFFAMGDAVYNDADDTTSRGSQKDFFGKLRSNPDEKVDITTLRWKNLPGTARELDKVSPLFTDKEILRREQVTEKNLRTLNAGGELSKYKYMLFAAHGLFVPERPEYSSIVLSQNFNDEDNDGYVTVGEWMGYDLRSNLIYLSACESGRGDYQAGEGIVGIPYALTVAGNKDTVMSLWKVNDAATAEFTSAVFEKLSRGQSEVKALNETKREFLRGKHPLFSSPYVWAAFVLYGI